MTQVGIIYSLEHERDIGVARRAMATSWIHVIHTVSCHERVTVARQLLYSRTCSCIYMYTHKHVKRARHVVHTRKQLEGSSNCQSALDDDIYTLISY